MSAGSSQDLLVDLYKITQGPPTRTSTRPWSRSSYMTHHETLARKNHKISLAGSKRAKIRTGLQSERSDARKVPRGLRERWQNSQRTTTRVIRYAQSAEKVARGLRERYQNSHFAPCHKEERADTHKVTRRLRVSATDSFVEGYKVLHKASIAAHFVRACAVEMHMDISQGK